MGNREVRQIRQALCRLPDQPSGDPSGEDAQSKPAIGAAIELSPGNGEAGVRTTPSRQWARQEQRSLVESAVPVGKVADMVPACRDVCSATTRTRAGPRT